YLNIFRLKARLRSFRMNIMMRLPSAMQMVNLRFLFEFILSQIDKILGDISIQVSESDEYISEAVKKLLEVMEYDIPYTSKILMEKLGLKSKEGFRRNYLRPAIDMNLICMTIPDKPNSRNQRYVKI